MRNNSVIPCGLSHESVSAANTVTCNAFAGPDKGTLIPTPKLIHKIDFGLTEWILVIEKEVRSLLPTP
jgi:meiotic recombination protein SPO11